MRDLTDRARRGDAEALAELWRRHHHRVVRYLRGRSEAAADDLASQVWIDVARGLDRFEGGDDDFPRWLFTIARRRYVDHVRRAVARPEYAADDIGSLASGPDGTSPSSETVYDDESALDRALTLVRRLPDPMAEVVLLRVVGDLSVSEVAAITGKSEGYVRVLAHRGLERLRHLVEQIDPDRQKSVTNPAAHPIKEVT